MDSAMQRPRPASGTRSINLERRAEIGAERRARSRSAILLGAFRLFGTATGQTTRIEDICTAAGIARGTFYNHFSDLEQLKHELLDEMTREFDRAVHLVFRELEGPAEQTAVAIRHYLHAAAQNPGWGWAMINSGTPGHIFGKTVWQNCLQTVREGIEAGAFRLSSAEIGRDILLGTVSSATVSIVRGGMAPSCPEEITQHILMAFGLTPDEARHYASRPLPALPPFAQDIVLAARLPATENTGGRDF